MCGALFDLLAAKGHLRGIEEGGGGVAQGLGTGGGGARFGTWEAVRYWHSCRFASRLDGRRAATVMH